MSGLRSRKSANLILTGTLICDFYTFLKEVSSKTIFLLFLVMIQGLQSKKCIFAANPAN